MNVLLRKQQKMRENGRNWDKKYNVDINKDNSKTIIVNFGKFAISDCCFVNMLATAAGGERPYHIQKSVIRNRAWIYGACRLYLAITLLPGQGDMSACFLRWNYIRNGIMFIDKTVC